MTTSPDKPLAAMAGISKRFGGVEVLRDVRFEVFGGEVHVLAGENGAGKSTLVKILAGVYDDYRGTIEIEGRWVRPCSPIEARALGVAVIHQELSLVPSMSVADNLFLGQPLTRRGLIRDHEHRRQARALLGQLGIEPDVNVAVEDLPIGTRQLVEIAKTLRHDAKVIVMDEPTSALSAPEVERLFTLIQRLKAQGRGIVYITHKMEEIERIADRITVLRDGQWVGTAPAAELPTPKLVRWMIGREVESQFPRHQPQPGPVLLRVEDFSVFDGSWRGRPLVDHVSLSVRAGEILGIGGLQGSGASELLMGLFGGCGRLARGRAWLDELPLPVRSPRHAIRRGIALLTNDRKATGLVLGMSIVANATMADLPRLAPGGWRRPQAEWAATARLGRALGLRAASLGIETGELSGGNQQKVALAKWLQTDPRLLLLDEPTRGVDVGAKHEIYELMNQWTSRGIGIILITSEMPELLAMSDRIVVMHRGRVTSRLAGEEATADRVLEAAMGKTMEDFTA